MRNTVPVSVDDILSLVSCAEDYGFSNNVLLDGLAGMLGYWCSDEEIEEFAADFLTDDNRERGYNEGDYEESKDCLTEWRDKYCVPHPDHEGVDKLDAYRDARDALLAEFGGEQGGNVEDCREMYWTNVRDKDHGEAFAYSTEPITAESFDVGIQDGTVSVIRHTYPAWNKDAVMVIDSDYDCDARLLFFDVAKRANEHVSAAFLGKYRR